MKDKKNKAVLIQNPHDLFFGRQIDGSWVNSLEQIEKNLKNKSSIDLEQKNANGQKLLDAILDSRPELIAVIARIMPESLGKYASALLLNAICLSDYTAVKALLLAGASPHFVQKYKMSQIKVIISASESTHRVSTLSEYNHEAFLVYGESDCYDYHKIEQWESTDEQIESINVEVNAYDLAVCTGHPELIPLFDLYADKKPIEKSKSQPVLWSFEYKQKEHSMRTNFEQTPQQEKIKSVVKTSQVYATKACASPIEKATELAKKLYAAQSTAQYCFLKENNRAKMQETLGMLAIMQDEFEDSEFEVDLAQNDRVKEKIGPICREIIACRTNPFEKALAYLAKTRRINNSDYEKRIKHFRSFLQRIQDNLKKGQNPLSADEVNTVRAEIKSFKTRYGLFAGTQRYHDLLNTILDLKDSLRDSYIAFSNENLEQPNHFNLPLIKADEITPAYTTTEPSAPPEDLVAKYKH